MGGKSLASTLLQRLPILPRQLTAKVKQHSVNKVYIGTSNYTTSSSNNLSQVDLMKKLLKDKFPLAKHIEVEDISGGCGAMYEVSVETVEFSGLSIVNQHRLINDILKEQIKHMHGITIQTSIPPESEK